MQDYFVLYSPEKQAAIENQILDWFGLQYTRNHFNLDRTYLLTKVPLDETRISELREIQPDIIISTELPEWWQPS